MNARPQTLPILLVAASLTACSPTPTATPTAATPPSPTRAPDDAMAKVNTVAEDREVWQQLLSDHAKIYRTVVHRQEGERGIVEATTESDDPVVAARIKNHAVAMQHRMKAGAQVRVWDEVFEERFKRHDLVTLELTMTEKGVKIVEWSTDPETIALLRSHAMGVSEFIREGHAAGSRATPRLPVGAPLPPPEVAIGGVAHRFLLAQPDQAQLAILKDSGVDAVVNFRKPNEPGVYDEAAAVQALALPYCTIPYKDPNELSIEVLTASRGQFQAAAANGTSLALHCRTGNRVGPGWAMYLALDRGMSVDDAIASAKAIGMVDPLFESIVRDAIRRERASEDAAWTPVAMGALSPHERARVARAEDARAAMYARLITALGQAMARPGDDGQPVGPAGAVGVCKLEAPKIAQAVAREKGVMIGRTSDRLRNPGNSAPVWATALLADRPDDPRVATNPDGSLGVTLPIRISNECLACHGPADQLAPAVRDALAAMYPNDKATGYAAGDLRGWFWVELPPTK